MMAFIFLTYTGFSYGQNKVFFQYVFIKKKYLLSNLVCGRNCDRQYNNLYLLIYCEGLTLWPQGTQLIVGGS